MHRVRRCDIGGTGDALGAMRAKDRHVMALARPIPDPLVELVAARFRCLGQPARLHLVERLDRFGQLHVQALADDLDITQQNASKHLGALWQAGLVARRREGRVSWYTLAAPETFALIEDVAMTIGTALREHHGDE